MKNIKHSGESEWDKIVFSADGGRVGGCVVAVAFFCQKLVQICDTKWIGQFYQELLDTVAECKREQFKKPTALGLSLAFIQLINIKCHFMRLIRVKAYEMKMPSIEGERF